MWLVLLPVPDDDVDGRALSEGGHRGAVFADNDEMLALIGKNVDSFGIFFFSSASFLFRSTCCFRFNAPLGWVRPISRSLPVPDMLKREYEDIMGGIKIIKNEEICQMAHAHTLSHSGTNCCSLVANHWLKYMHTAPNDNADGQACSRRVL